MTVCTDVYVRPQTCDLISIYPSQVHPAPAAGVRPSGPKVSWTRGVHPRSRVLSDDDEIAIALALLNL